MSLLIIFAWFVLGLVLLVGGAEILVRGAKNISLMLGISPLIVGLTVVAFGTSAPEVAVSVKAAFEGNADIGVGNVIGSNISNILLVLGLSAAVAPIVVSRKLIRLDVPIMIAISLLAYVLSLNGNLGNIEAFIMLGVLLGYIVFLIINERKEKAALKKLGEEVPKIAMSGKSWALNLAFVAGGLYLLVLGSGFLVDSAVKLARIWGISELIIGLTIVSVGTSLPELATSVVASFKGERNMAVGNIVGSNIFNLLLVLGATALVSPLGIDVSMNAINFDFPVMIAVSIACLPIFARGYSIKRWEGMLFVGYYAAYVIYLIMDSVNHPYIEQFNIAMTWFVIPLTVLTMGILLFRWFTREKETTA